MKIKKIILRSFGKFQNRTIDFADGVNMLYGENEAGKSTIYHFIEGMFYGFYKANLKNKKNTDDYNQYLPWDNSNDYSGVMFIEDQDRIIRIERNFMKNHDEVRIYNDITGEDITESYDYDGVTKLYDPALRHLGINQNTYRNTISVAQMNSKTGEELIMEIKNNLMNYSETSTTDISLTKIMNTIADKKAEIGTSRAKKSEFSKTLNKIEALELEKEESIQVLENIKSIQLESIELNNQLRDIEAKKSIIEKSMIQFKDSAFEENFQKAKEIQEEINALDYKLEALVGYTKIPKEEINQAIANVNSLEMMRLEYAMFEERIEEINHAIEGYKAEIQAMEDQSVDIGTSEKLIRDVYKYEEFENQKNIVHDRIHPEVVEEAQLAYKVTKSVTGRAKTTFVISLIVTILLSLVKFIEYTKPFLVENLSFLDNYGNSFDAFHEVITSLTWVTLGALILFLILTILMAIKKKSGVNHLEELERKLKREEDEIRVAENRLTDLEEKQKVVLEKYQCEDIVALHSLKDKKSLEELFYTESFKRTSKLEEEIEVLQNKVLSERGKIERKQAEILEAESMLTSVMEALQIDHYKELRIALEKQYDYKSLEQEKQSKIDFLNQLTKGEVFDFITLEDRENTEDADFIKASSYEELEEQLRSTNDVIVDYNRKISELEAVIANEEMAVRPIVEIEDQLGMKRQKLEKLSSRMEALNMLEDAFEALSNHSTTSFAPSLNEQISKMIAIATDYKYTEVKVGSDMEISVVDNDMNKLIGVEALSAGTIDLMYFALRLGLADLINGELSLPLILDDSFVQYDDRRLVKVLEMLSKFNRQVILFTCHNREKQLLGRMSEMVQIQSL